MRVTPRCAAAAVIVRRDLAFPLAKFCQVLGWIAIAMGALFAFGMIADSRGPDQVVYGLMVGAGIMLSAIFWFIAARVIILLARIAHNTEAPSTPASAIPTRPGIMSFQPPAL